jgi:hypothetical protein
LTNVNIVLEDDLLDRHLRLTKALQKLTTYAKFDRRFASLQEGSLFGNFPSLHSTWNNFYTNVLMQNMQFINESLPSKQGH